jgi:immunoglobulin-binding protein 1
MDTSGATLRDQFATARRQQEDLSQLDPRSGEYKDNLQQAISGYEECRMSIAQLALFSKNEEVDDISTQDIQYELTFLVDTTLLLTMYKISGN